MKSQNDHSLDGKELAAVAFGLAMVLACQLVVTHSLSLFDRYFWSDELYTYTIVTDPDIKHMFYGLAHGTDTQPPGLYIVLRAATWLMGSDEITFRGIAFASGCLALIGAYVVLRQAYPILPALAGMLAIWSFPLVQRQAFEARHYAPWLAGIVWYTYWLAKCFKGPTRIGHYVVLAFLAIFLCTIHYFGVITWALSTLFIAGYHAPSWREMRKVLAAAVWGPIALLACVPFFLGQRDSLSGVSWVIPPPLTDVLFSLVFFLIPLFLYRISAILHASLRPGGDGAAVMGLIGQIMLCPVLMVFSLIVPVQLLRYMMPALLGFAPAAAFAVSRLPRVGGGIAIMALVICSGFNLRNLALEHQGAERKTDRLISTIREQAPNAPVLFELIIPWNQVNHYAPDVADRCFFLDFNVEGQPQADPLRIHTRDFAHTYSRFYGKPRLLSRHAYQTMPVWYVVSQSGSNESAINIQERYDGFQATSVGQGVFKMTRKVE